MKDSKYSYDEFIAIIGKLRALDGCPWDREQTHESLKMCLMEEAYEVIEGIDILSKTGDASNLCEELGDVLLQVAMHAEIASEEGLFDMTDVADSVSRKMIFRHPHVFGDEKADTSREVLKNWEEIKKKEKDGKKRPEDILTVREREETYKEIILLLCKGMEKRGIDAKKALRDALGQISRTAI